jgi:hypothetical protein
MRKLAYKIISDTAFPVTGPLQGRIVTPLKDNDLDRIAPDLRGYIQNLSTVLTRCRQVCEWVWVDHLKFTDNWLFHFLLNKTQGNCDFII